MNCLKNVVIWYEDHKHRCPYEPHLAELDPTFGLYTTAVWQCEAGHRYFQDLHSPLKPLSDSDADSDKGGSGAGGRGGGARRPPGCEGSTAPYGGVTPDPRPSRGSCQPQASTRSLTVTRKARAPASGTEPGPGRLVCTLPVLLEQGGGPRLPGDTCEGLAHLCPRPVAGRARLGCGTPGSAAGGRGGCRASGLGARLASPSSSVVCGPFSFGPGRSLPASSSCRLSARFSSSLPILGS